MTAGTRNLIPISALRRWTLGGLPAFRGAWAWPGRSFRDANPGEPIMRILTSVAAAAGLLALAACGDNTPAENAAENVEAVTENQADMLEEQADNATNEATEEGLENQADAVREEGENKAEAIEESNVSGM